MFSSARLIKEYMKFAINCHGKFVHCGNKFKISKTFFENERRTQDKNVKYTITEPDSEWNSKLNAYHELLDINNDGIVSIEDMRELTKRFSEVNNMTEEQSSKFSKIIENLWYKHWGCIDQSDCVTVEMYLSYIQYVKQNDCLKNEVIQLLPYLFKTVDKDENGHITKEEYDKFLECIGSSNKNNLIKSLGIINDTDETIHLDDLISVVTKILFHNNDKAKK